MDFKEYIKELDQLYQVGNTTEHSFRGALAIYLKSLLPKFVVTNEPRRIDCGAPDYVITLKNEPIAFLEAKDVNDGDLDGRKEHKEQFTRYMESLDRVVFTDYLDFHLYLEGKFVDSVRIAETRGNRIIGIPENETKFNEMVISLATGGRQKISSSATLARQMAAKAHLLAEAVKKTFELDGEDGDSEVSGQLRAFREVLIHDLKADEFADIYAQTIVYGMFTARLNDATPEDFSRQEAAELIPKSNPFLRRIFQSIAVYDLDDSIAWIVDDLAAMFAATDADKIMQNYGSNKLHSDPIVHFYEDFLAEYDPKLRKARGVWYTPAPVVKFIVKSVDEILQREFGLPMGLADSSTIKVRRAIQQSKDKRTADGMKHEDVDVHRVQILDPATGTGTFLAEVIQQIRDKFNGLEGLWPSYVEKSLIPRIHGFEILMASYTIAHLKLALTLKYTGYEGQTNRRLNVFLTNSLEEATPRATNLFAKWLSDEADAASAVKAETPVMICLGNPPYNNSSRNKNDWINALIKEYKAGLNEKKINLDDDYIKFIRLGQNYIERNREGILAFITNNSFVNGITHRQMRKSLLQTFDDIYILNLHGYYMEEFEDILTVDENVFDISQGVSINLFVKTNRKKVGELGNIHYADLIGTRKHKYGFLDEKSVFSVEYRSIPVKAPEYFFGEKNRDNESVYKQGFSLDKLFIESSVGVFSGKDAFNISYEKDTARRRIKDIISLPNEELYRLYDVETNASWSLVKAKKDLGDTFDEDCIKPILFRPFDTRFVYYRKQSGGLLARPCYDVMKNMLNGSNVGLIVPRQTTQDWRHVFISNSIMDSNLLASARLLGAGKLMPLYVERTGLGGDGKPESKLIPNLDGEIVGKFSSHIGETVEPLGIMDYIYAVLHSPKYRWTYKEFLKIDFPRIPYPKDVEQFHRLAEKGAELRKLHLMEGAASWPMVVSFPVAGVNSVEKISYADGKVFINTTQYFGGVSDLAWNFFIGGYQPAQKWLKDRKGRTLDYQDILHYGHIIYALQETDRIMKEIDEIGVV